MAVSSGMLIRRADRNIDLKHILKTFSVDCMHAVISSCAVSHFSEIFIYLKSLKIALWLPVSHGSKNKTREQHMCLKAFVFTAKLLKLT